MSGYILISKSIIDSGVWSKPPLYIKVWLYLLSRAQYSDYGKLKRGQLFTSIPEIQRACSYMVGYRKETPSRKEIWGVIEFLRNPHEEDTKGTRGVPMIETTKVTHGLIVTICKYNDYQNPKFYGSNSEGANERTPKRTRKEQQGDNIKKENIKNKKNKKNYYSLKEKEKKEKAQEVKTLDDVVADFWARREQ